MILRNVVVLLGITVLLGCSENVVQPQHTASESAAKTERMVPIKWDYLMQAVVPPNPGPADFIICQIPSPPSPAPMDMPVAKNWTAQGIMTHLGKLDEASSSATFSSCTFGMYEGHPALVGGLDAIMVGANGDALELSGSLTLTMGLGPDGPYPLASYGDFDIIGGSGRFHGASGWMDAVEEVTPDGARGIGLGMVTPPGRLH
ncbi:MAG: hypothetical protein R3178_07345 [Rhodothermales bacterium]|nr:hypothetical protein [Rhodothermales bacterium]